MPSSQQPETLRIERSTSATPDEAWALIADITRMGDWAPETTSAVWRGGATGPTLGARFTGTNQMGSKKERSNGTVSACEPGRRFAFHVLIGPFSVADWAYEFEPTEEGGVVTEL